MLCPPVVPVLAKTCEPPVSFSFPCACGVQRHHFWSAPSAGVAVIVVVLARREGQSVCGVCGMFFQSITEPPHKGNIGARMLAGQVWGGLHTYTYGAQRGSSRECSPGLLLSLPQPLTRSSAVKRTLENWDDSDARLPNSVGFRLCAPPHMWKALVVRRTEMRQDERLRRGQPRHQIRSQREEEEQPHPTTERTNWHLVKPSPVRVKHKQVPLSGPADNPSTP